MPGHLAMFSVITEEPLIGRERVEAASEQVLQVPRGEVMVGVNGSVVMSDFVSRNTQEQAWSTLSTSA